MFHLVLKLVFELLVQYDYRPLGAEPAHELTGVLFSNALASGIERMIPICTKSITLSGYVTGLPIYNLMENLGQHEVHATVNRIPLADQD